MQALLKQYQGISISDAREIKNHVNLPVICTGGFQQASYIRKAISEGFCDAVSIARPLIANNDLVAQLAQGKDLPSVPCTYCNQCLFRSLTDPLGCYDLRRYNYDENLMVEEINSVFKVDDIEQINVFINTKNQQIRSLEELEKSLRQKVSELGSISPITAATVETLVNEIDQYVDDSVLNGLNNFSQLFQQALERKNYKKAAEIADAAYKLCEKYAEALSLDSSRDTYRRLIALSSYWKLKRDLYSVRGGL